MSNVSRLDIERFFTGELQGQQAKLVQKHLDSHPEDQRFFEGLENQKDTFLEQHPFSEFKRNAGLLKETPTPWWKKWFAASSFSYRPLAVTATLLFVALVVFMNQPEKELISENQIRFKSPVALDYFYRRNGKINPGNENIRFREGDEIQFLYTPNQYKYLSLLSIDQKGKVSFYHPGGNIVSVAAQPGSRQPFPHSVVLDDALGREIFIGKFSDQPLTKDQLLSQLHKLHKNYSKDILKVHQKIQAELEKGNTSFLSLILQKER